MDGSRPCRRGLGVALLVAAAVAVVAACTSDGDGAAATTSPDDTSTSEPSTTDATTTTLDAEEEVLAAYRDFWEVYLEVGGMTGPFDPEMVGSILRSRSTGPEYDHLFDLFQADRLAGQVRRGTLDLAPAVVSLDGSTATVSDCIDDHTGIYRADTGERVDTDTPELHNVTVDLVVEEGVWKVERLLGVEEPCTR
jgi:hypothetical protein